MIIWDINLRLFHWILVILIILSIISAKFDNLFLHQFFGSMSLGLIMFRVFWGFFGPHYSRFKTFFYSPRELLLFLNGKKINYRGHNPLGSLSVFGFYIVILVLSVSGLFSSDDILFEGPLANLTPDLTKYWNRIHNIFHYVIYIFVSLHLLAIFFYQFVKKEKLINQMIDGKPRDNNFEDKPYKGNIIFIGFIFLLICLTLPPLLIML